MSNKAIAQITQVLQQHKLSQLLPGNRKAFASFSGTAGEIQSIVRLRRKALARGNGILAAIYVIVPQV